MDQYLTSLLNKLEKKLPKFSDGRIDYTDSIIAPVVTLFVKYDGKILLMKRSQRVGNYKGRWCTVAGYIDEHKPVRRKMLEELNEETGVSKKSIKSFNLGKRYSFSDKKIDRTFVVFPGIVELKKKPRIKIDWEHTEYRWISPKDLKKFNIVPHLDKSLAHL